MKKGAVCIKKSIIASVLILSIQSSAHASAINLGNNVDMTQDLPKVVNVAKILTAQQIANGKTPDLRKNLEIVGKLYLNQMLWGNLNKNWMNACNDFLSGGFCSTSTFNSSSWLDGILSGSANIDIFDTDHGVNVNVSTNEVPASTGVDISNGNIGGAIGGVIGGDTGEIIGGIIGGGGSSLPSGGNWSENSNLASTPGVTNGLGDLSSLFTGRQLSLNASYSVTCTHPQFVQGFASIDPENPLKHDNVTTKAWVTALTLPPTASISWQSPPVLVESKVYDTATPVGQVEEKKYVFAYIYQPPKDPHGNFPAPQKGVCVVTLKFKVSEFNALGGSGDSYNSVGGGSGGSYSGGGIGMVTGPSIISSGNITPNSNSEGITAPSVPRSDISGITGALNDLMNGGIQYPFGSLTSPSVNVNIPGIGNGLMSLSSTINGFLKDMMPHSSGEIKTGNGEQALPDGPMPTPDEVRQEHINDMSGIVNTAQEILKARGVVIQNPDDVKKLYDPDSPYTDPKEAWDFNRLTQFIK